MFGVIGHSLEFSDFCPTILITKKNGDVSRNHYFVSSFQQFNQLCHLMFGHPGVVLSCRCDVYVFVQTFLSFPTTVIVVVASSVVRPVVWSVCGR